MEFESYSIWDLANKKQRIQIVLFMIFIMPVLFWGVIAVFEIGFNNKHICKNFHPHAFLCPTPAPSEEKI